VLCGLNPRPGRLATKTYDDTTITGHAAAVFNADMIRVSLVHAA
jgi:hypothetical protein